MVTGLPTPLIQDGFIQVPEGPGLGIEVDEDYLESLLVRQADLRKG